VPLIADLVPMIVILAATGAFAGVLAGLLGVGGGIVLVPALFYVFTGLGYNSPQLMQICLATSLATIIVTSLRSVLAHNRKGAVEWETLRRWAPGIAVGAVLGVAFASGLRTVTLQAIFAALAFAVALYMAFARPHWRLADRMPEGGRVWAFAPGVGFFSVLMGIGGGSFGVPLMTLHNVPMHRAVATAAGFGVTIAVPGVAGFLLMQVAPEGRPPLTFGAVNLPAFLLIIATTLVTTPLGVRLAHAMDPVPLRRVFAVFLMLVAANMMRKALGW
jgi:uncharacterized membrane protein YfcA